MDAAKLANDIKSRFQVALAVFQWLTGGRRPEGDH